MTNDFDPLRVMLADDEPLARSYLEELLSAIPDLQLLGSFKNGGEILEACRKDRPDLLILDIEMPGLTGFDVVQKLQADDMPSVIFATAYDNYAIDAFDLNAVDYLLKPFDANRFSCHPARENPAKLRSLTKGPADQRFPADPKPV